MTVQMAAPASVVFTENAAKRVFELMQEENNTNLKLRVYIEGGGCSGFQYGFTFDETASPDDQVVKREIVLKGSEEDEGGEGSSSGTAAVNETANPDDQVVKREIASADKAEEDDGGEGDNGLSSGTAAVELLIDPLSFQYLVGAEIDYVDDLEGERFVIRNPNAQTTCGCGSSFSV